MTHFVQYDKDGDLWFRGNGHFLIVEFNEEGFDLKKMSEQLSDGRKSKTDYGHFKEWTSQYNLASPIPTCFLLKKDLF